MKPSVCRVVVFVGFIVAATGYTSAQTTPDSSSSVPGVNLATDYPKDRAGVFVQSSDWVSMAAVMPSKTRAKRGLAASLSYGAVPASVVAEYNGPHAQVQIEPGRPVICLCHMISLPGDPVLVRLHPKKDLRELDGGRMTVLPIVGGSKMADANRSDLIPADVSQPESMVWLVRPQQSLPSGEYALMLGTQNVNIFPFTVAASSADASTPSPAKP
jgi:hypothetical protein